MYLSYLTTYLPRLPALVDQNIYNRGVFHVDLRQSLQQPHLTQPKFLPVKFFPHLTQTHLSCLT